MKYQLLPDKVIMFNNQIYNSSTMTDEIAEDYLEKFPKAIGNFKINAEAKAEKPAEVKEVKKEPVKRGPKASK